MDPFLISLTLLPLFFFAPLHCPPLLSCFPLPLPAVGLGSCPGEPFAAAVSARCPHFLAASGLSFTMFAGIVQLLPPSLYQMPAQHVALLAVSSLHHVQEAVCVSRAIPDLACGVNLS